MLVQDSVAAALTKDKKQLRGKEIAVHLAWKSTLYVTNFPESADDAVVRDLFGQYGLIFDVRWPSKKFKNTRRFCYVQYTSPSSAEKALELHGRELEPDRPMSVLISNPERKKERTDADANEKEIYVAGLSKFTTKEDLMKLFQTYGPVKDVRMALEQNGQAKGFAFIEFDEEKDAQAALGANNYELKKRRIAVTLADSRVRARNRNLTDEAGLGQQAVTRNRSLRIRNLPPATHEGLLQQALEKLAVVKRVEIFQDKNEAVVELETAAEAGKLLLRTEHILFNEQALELSEESQSGLSRSRQAAPPTKMGGLFVPRAAASRPRAGLGPPRKPGIGAGGKTASSAPSDVDNGIRPSQPQLGRGQDDFRKMLSGGR
jgi:RNA recognition motif-containing protein